MYVNDGIPIILYGIPVNIRSCWNTDNSETRDHATLNSEIDIIGRLDFFSFVWPYIAYYDSSYNLILLLLLLCCFIFVLMYYWHTVYYDCDYNIMIAITMILTRWYKYRAGSRILFHFHCLVRCSHDSTIYFWIKSSLYWRPSIAYRWPRRLALIFSGRTP